MHTIQLNPGRYVVKRVDYHDPMFSFIEEYMGENLENGIKVALNDGKECVVFCNFYSDINVVIPVENVLDERNIYNCFEAFSYVLFISTGVDKKIMYDGNIIIIDEEGEDSQEFADF